MWIWTQPAANPQRRAGSVSANPDDDRDAWFRFHPKYATSSHQSPQANVEAPSLAVFLDALFAGLRNDKAAREAVEKVLLQMKAAKKTR